MSPEPISAERLKELRETIHAAVRSPVTGSFWPDILAALHLLEAERDELREANEEWHRRDLAAWEELTAERDRLREALADRDAELKRHALANDGCVPGAAYRDLADRLNAVQAAVDRVDQTKTASVMVSAIYAALGEESSP